MSDTLGLGKLITTEQQRDAIHIAVAPVIADEKLLPGERIGFVEGGNMRVCAMQDVDSIGIVDPFLAKAVTVGQQFWMYLNPGSITSLRHDWTHPAFVVAGVDGKSPSEVWMRAWAKKHIANYYDDEESMSEDDAYEFAIDAGRETHIGRFEDAREHIDGEWWSHWEIITGEKGDRDAYFTCSC